jgi:hypothetical protein
MKNEMDLTARFIDKLIYGKHKRRKAIDLIYGLVEITGPIFGASRSNTLSSRFW